MVVFPFTIRVMIEFLLIFDETNFVKVSKIREFYGPELRGPYDILDNETFR